MKTVKISQLILTTILIGFAHFSFAQNTSDVNSTATDQSNTSVSTPVNPNDNTDNAASTTTVTTETAPATTTTESSPAPASTKVMTNEDQAALTPQDVLQRLKDGNLRFTGGNMKNRDLLTQASTTALGQFPKAVILNCIDSRTPPEIIFDQGIGDIFAIRIAGNIQNDDILGSMEFATKLSGAKLIAVIGHTSCGAIRGACQQAKLGFLTQLLQKIQPAVKQAAIETKTKDCKKDTFIDQIAKDNVIMVMKQIQARDPVIKKLIQDGKIGMVGGIQDISTGTVTFFDDQSTMPVVSPTSA